MNTKLTLRLDEEVINQIKTYALRNHLSVSALTEDLYKQILIEKQMNVDGINSPIARKYKGILGKDAGDVEQARYDYLKKKHVR